MPKNPFVPRPNKLGGFFAGAGAISLLLLIASTVLPTEEGHDVFHETLASVLSPAISGSWDLAADIAKRIHSILDGLSNALTAVFIQVLQTAITVAVLVRCLGAILLFEGEEGANGLALRWRLRLASLIADLAGASHSRRRALVEAGNGAVVDWLLEAVGHGEFEWRFVQAEAARAIAHFLSDASTCEELLGRPSALSHLLLFTASIQPNVKTSKHKKLQVFHENDNRSRGKRMLVAAMMDIITSSCESGDNIGIQPKLSGSADRRDIAAALKIIKEGGLYLDEGLDDDEGSGEDRGGLQGIGIEVLGGTGMAGVQKLEQHVLCSMGLAQNFLSAFGGGLATRWRPSQYWQGFVNSRSDFLTAGPFNPRELKESTSGHGLWDDLQGRYVAVPFAAWAIANWAQASRSNCVKIAELDKDGDAIMAAVLAPERTVKWQGAIAAHCLVENGWEEPAVTWSSALLRTAVEASDVEDVQLALVTLSSFHSCIRKSSNARKAVSETSLPLMRSLAKKTSKNMSLQKVLAHALEILSFSGAGLTLEEGMKWSSILVQWTCNHNLEDTTRSAASRVLAHVLDVHGQDAVLLSQAWLAMLLTDAVNGAKVDSAVKAKGKGLVQNQTNQIATQAAIELVRVIWQSVGEMQVASESTMTTGIFDSPWGDLLTLDMFQMPKGLRKDPKAKLTTADAAEATLKAVKALTELSTEDKAVQLKIIKAGVLHLLRRVMLGEDYEKFSAADMGEAPKVTAVEQDKVSNNQQKGIEALSPLKSKAPPAAHIRRHAARLLSTLALQPSVSSLIRHDATWCRWLEDCANNQIPSCTDLKIQSHARATLLNMEVCKDSTGESGPEIPPKEDQSLTSGTLLCPHYEDNVFLLNTESPNWKRRPELAESAVVSDVVVRSDTPFTNVNVDAELLEPQSLVHGSNFDVDVIFVHGLCGGPFKTWRIAENKASTTGKAGLVEKIDADSGREGTCWPKQWLASDLPACRLLTVKYKTNLSQWSGATLPLQEVSSMLLDKLLAAGVGDRPVVFVTHSMGGLVVKQMLMQAGQDKSRSHIVKNTVGIVFYSCPHFGSKLADMPWRFGLVLRPAPSICELRSGSTRLEELNQFIRTLHKGGLQVLSFSETKVTPLVEGYGGWALRMEVVPIESAYPGFGELVVLDGTDHVNSCKPLSRDDTAYTQTLHFLQKLVKLVQKSASAS